MSTTIHVGDCRETLREYPDGYFHCAISSPPYWSLRDYQTPPLLWGGDAGCEHEWVEDTPFVPRHASETKSEKQQSNRGTALADDAQSSRSFCRLCGCWRGSLGLEPDLDLYLAHIVEVFHEVKRVLRDDGQMFLNISDKRAKSREWCGIPHKLVFALQEDGWRFEDEVIWQKPDCMPGSQTNRFTRSHEYVFMLNKSKTAFFDGDAVREPNQSGPSDIKKMRESKDRIGGKNKDSQDPLMKGTSLTNIGRKRSVGDPATGRSRRSVWTIPTAGLKLAHFASFPPALVEPCIKAGTSERGCCPACGKGWVRVVEKGKVTATGGKGKHFFEIRGDDRRGEGKDAGMQAHEHITTGWEPGCACKLNWYPNATCGNRGYLPTPCIVLDPFGGSGTVAVVAARLGRDAILCELNEDYAEMARKRIADDAPMFNQVEVR